MSNKGDYGYFGTGSEGYAHYMQSFNETTSSGSHNGKRNSNQGKEVSNAEFILILLLLLPLAPILIPLYLIYLGLS